MSHNQIKIVSDQKRNSLAFYLKNEYEQWCLVSNESALSRQEYINAKIMDRADKIIDIINSVYNPGNRGVDIFFEGDEDDFLFLKKKVEELPVDNNISCVMQKTLIAVAGKVGAGKTTLIKGFGAHRGSVLQCHRNDEILSYTDGKSSVTWYEIPGIDYDEDNMTKAKKAVDRLAELGLTTFIYCVGTPKFEQLEQDLIFYVRNNYPAVKILVVFTRSTHSDDQQCVDEISQYLEGIKVIPVLAVEMKTRGGGIISAYGLDNVDRYIFEGK